jgi:signal transduction histidine kinase
MTALVLGALQCAVLLGKKRFPVTTLAASLVICEVLAILLRHTYPVTPADVVALYAVGRYRGRGVALASALSTVVIGFAAAQLSPRIPSYTIHSVTDLGWAPFAVLAGAWVRTQCMYLIGAQERADRAEREREEEARRCATEERLRIARELHDIVGHALMSINVTSSVSARLSIHDPEAAREALRTINTLSGSALGEIRKTLNLLREGYEPLIEPRPGLDDLPALVERSRQDGLPVTLHEEGYRPEIPAIVGFTVYRIVQESLTNVRRHATDVRSVTIILSYTPESLDATVTNDGAVVGAWQNGIGLQGMRERVTATGGRLDTVALPAGGFRVHARLPLKEC